MNPTFKEKFFRGTEAMESGFYVKLSEYVQNLVYGLYLFQSRKGPIFAAAATFFTLLSFTPLLLLLISAYAQITGDVSNSYQAIMTFMKSSFPALSEEVFANVDLIVRKQLKLASSTNWLFVIVLLFGTVSIAQTLDYGFHTIAKYILRGGFLIDQIRSLIAGTLLCFFFLTFFSLSGANKASLAKAFWMQIVYSLGFFTFYYKLISPVPVSFRSALRGATSFVGLFIVGKSCYWIYLQLSQQDLTHNYGNFYAAFLAILWIYYVFSAFFYGAAVALVEVDREMTKANESEMSGSDLTPIAETKLAEASYLGPNSSASESKEKSEDKGTEAESSDEKVSRLSA